MGISKKELESGAARSKVFELRFSVYGELNRTS